MKKQKHNIFSLKNLCKKDNIFLCIIVGLLGIMVLFLVALYVFVPTYRFENPKPFAGKFINNPYQNLTDVNWNYLDLRNDSLIPTYEYGFGLFPTRYLCVDYQSKIKLDYPFYKNIHFKQYIINRLNKTSSLVIPTHVDAGFKQREIKHLDNYRLMEVISPYGNYFYYWDLALSSGRHVNILATGYKSVLNDVKYVYKTAVNADLNDKTQIINSLKNGDSYAVRYLDGKSDLPELKSLTLKNDTLFVEATKEITALQFIGQNGIVKEKLYPDACKASYVFKEDDSYIRIQMNFNDETIIYLNPVVRHEFQYFFIPSMSEMMKERTWLMRIVFVFVIIFFAKYLLTSKKEDVDEDKRECDK